MKKLLFILSLFTCTTGFAQKLSFEETEKYIQNVLTENETFYWPAETGYFIESIKAKNTAKVVFLQRNKDGGEKLIGTLNLFDVEEIEITQYSDVSFKFKNGEGKKLGEISGLTKENANRLKKAFEYLRTLCIKENDPFGN
jgi:hypothetical protein